MGTLNNRREKKSLTNKDNIMEHRNLSDELRNQIMEAASWGKADVTVRLNEKEVVNEQPVIEEATEEEEESIEEAVHACPLCASQLSDSIEEDRLLEHLNVVMGLVERLSQLDESEEEDIDTVIDNALAELLLQDTDEEE